MTVFSVNEFIENLEISFIVCGMKMAHKFWKIIWQCLKKLNMNLPYDLAVTFLVIYLREIKSYVHAKIWTQMFLKLYYTSPRTNLNVLQ